MSNNRSEWINDILNSEERQAMPIMTYPALPLIGRTVRDVITNGQAQFECMQALGEKYPAVAALTLMDLSVEAEAFGCPIKYCDHEVPTVTAPVVKEAEDLERLRRPVVGDGRTSVFLDAARRASAYYTDRPVLGGLIGPYSLAVRLRDMTQVMMDLMLDPDLIHGLLERCVSFLIDYAKAFKAHGAHGVLIAEPAAGLLSREACEEFSSAYVRRIVQAVQDDSFSVILHNCGRTTDLVSSLAGTGVRGVHFGNAINMMDVLPKVPENVLAFGNIDPAGTFRMGSADDVYLATIRLLMKTSEYPNFVLSSGCDIPPGTPLANLDAFFTALEEYNYMVRQTRCRKECAA